jgi:hypothetical protein
MRKQLDGGPARLQPSPTERTLDRRGFLELSLKRGAAGVPLGSVGYREGIDQGQACTP